MVQCAVGNRCEACTKGFVSDRAKPSAIDFVKVILLSFASSIAIFITFIGVSMIPVIGCMLNIIAAGACSYFSGQLIHKSVGYKHGRTLLPYVLVPMLTGLMLNPFTSPIFYLAAMCSIGKPADSIFSTLLLPALAAFTIIIPFMRD